MTSTTNQQCRRKRAKLFLFPAGPDKHDKMVFRNFMMLREKAIVSQGTADWLA
jgi:hypothetical protein